MTTLHQDEATGVLIRLQNMNAEVFFSFYQWPSHPVLRESARSRLAIADNAGDFEQDTSLIACQVCQTLQRNNTVLILLCRLYEARLQIRAGWDQKYLKIEDFYKCLICVILCIFLGP